MAIPTTSQGIYDLISGDAVVAPLLGTYTPRGGSAIPAIAVLLANEPLPEGTVVGGVEVVISEIGQPNPEPMLSGETLLNPTWRIYVSQWSRVGGVASLAPVANRIIALLPGCNASGITGDPPGEGIGLLDQIVISWRNPTVCVVSPDS